MAEYIDKNLAVEELENLRQQYEMHDDCDEMVAIRCKNAVLALPVADVALVVHGKWIPDKYGGIRCSACKRRPTLLVKTDFCPRCGAKMDL